MRRLPRSEAMSGAATYRSEMTRRHFLGQSRVSLGAFALASFVNAARSVLGATPPADPAACLRRHFLAKAKNVVFLSMDGGPSQLDLLDPKPKLKERNGQDIPK